MRERKFPRNSSPAMNTRRSPFAGVARRWSLRFCLLGVLLALPVSAWAVIDLNNDGVGDIWALYHSTEAKAPTADPDGDGQTNAQESAAGTDPRSPSSVVRITSMSLDAGGLHLTFPTLAGKRYQVQSASSLSSPSWQNVGAALPGTGGNVSTTYEASGTSQKFYRVLVQDVDTDGDGVTDWEELTLGYDPNSSRTDGIASDDDYTKVTKALQATNVITVVASDVNASEPSAQGVGVKSGVFQITRTGSLNAVVVRYSVSGSAVPGVDYTALSGQVSLPIGVHSAIVAVTPLADTKVESPESVTVTILSNSGYTIGSEASAAVLITDFTQPNGDGALARGTLRSRSGHTRIPQCRDKVVFQRHGEKHRQA